jgi:hypothetical protein
MLNSRLRVSLVASCIVGPLFPGCCFSGSELENLANLTLMIQQLYHQGERDTRPPPAGWHDNGTHAKSGVQHAKSGTRVLVLLGLLFLFRDCLPPAAASFVARTQAVGSQLPGPNILRAKIPRVASSAFLAAGFYPTTRPVCPNPQLRCRLLEPWDKSRVRMG